MHFEGNDLDVQAEHNNSSDDAPSSSELASPAAAEAGAEGGPAAPSTHFFSSSFWDWHVVRALGLRSLKGSVC
jgi:hypothetical protein